MTPGYFGPLSDTIKAAPPSETEELRVNGASFVTYDLFYADEKFVVSDLSQLGLVPITTKYPYLEGIFDLSPEERNNHRRFVLTKEISLNASFDLSLEFNGNAKIHVTIFADQFILLETMFVIDRRQLFPNIASMQPHRPLTTSELLSLFLEINADGDIFHRVEAVRLGIVGDLRGLLDIQLARTVHSSRKYSAIQIWDIEGLTEWAATNSWLPNGRQIVNTFAWELSALLNVNSDLNRRVRTWKDRTHEQVKNQIDVGIDAVAIHRVLVNEFVCMEVTQIDYPSGADSRSLQRMESYGYDSTSIFLWSYIVAQNCLLVTLSRSASERLAQLGKALNVLDTKSAVDGLRQDFLVAVKESLRFRSRTYEVLEKLYWLSDKVKEPRHARFILDQQTRARGPDVRRELKLKLDELRDITMGAAQLNIDIENQASIEQLREVAAAQRDAVKDIHHVATTISESERRLGFIKFLFSATAIFGFSDFMIGVTGVSQPIWMWQLIWGGVAVLVLGIVYALSQRPSKTSKKKNGKE
jgi:hypothetical protein